MIPFVPHISHECLELLGCTNINKWPEIKKDEVEITKIAVQVNGKTRDIIEIKKGLTENKVTNIVLNHSKAKKFIENNKITKTIFIKDKIINYIFRDK